MNSSKSFLVFICSNLSHSNIIFSKRISNIFEIGVKLLSLLSSSFSFIKLNHLNIFLILSLIHNSNLSSIKSENLDSQTLISLSFNL
jgi:hypothetical protein